MQKAKAFFLVCAGCFLLALSYHLGARSATAQAGSSEVGYAVSTLSSGTHFVMTPNGDIYAKQHSEDLGALPPRYIGNFWGGATAAAPSTWGRVKADYRK